MITKIELKNFKSHAHTVIEPGRVTALVGPNGAGKSTVLQAIREIMEFAVPSLNLDNRYFDSTKKLIREGNSFLQIKIIGGENNSHWLFDLSSSSEERQNIEFAAGAQVPAWGIFVRGEIEGHGEFDDGYTATPMEANSPVRFGHKIPQPVFDAVGKYAYLKASAANLAAPSYSEEIPPRVSSDGHGLASALANLMLSDSDDHQALVESLHQIVPIVKNVRVRPAKVSRIEKRVIAIDGKEFPFDENREVVGHEVIFDTQTIKGLPAHAMSDGTMLALGLLTLLWTSPNAHLILLDDIEAGLHPLAQRQLMQTIKTFAEKHDRQIILTSHSPYIVDALDAKDVWVMATDKEGISNTKRLSDHPDAKRALDVLTTGELWDAEGESWVIDNAPAELANA
jgi:energy-coupling factor transporter ATP-binding protein EcfA2